MSGAYASRKFWLAAGTTLLAAGLLIAGLIDGHIFQTLALAALTVYSAANVAQKATLKTDSDSSTSLKGTSP